MIGDGPALSIEPEQFVGGIDDGERVREGACGLLSACVEALRGGWRDGLGVWGLGEDTESRGGEEGRDRSNGGETGHGEG